MSDDPRPDGDPAATPETGPLGGLESGGMPDMGALLSQAMEMQEQLLAAQQEAARAEVEGVAGGGMVRVAMTGDLDVRSVTIAPEVVDPDDVEMLQDLVLAAVRDAFARVEEMQSSMLSGGMPDPRALLGELGGLGLGGAPGGTPEPGADAGMDLLAELLGGTPDEEPDDGR